MSPETIWWDQIGSQLHLIAQISELLEDDRSFVLQLRSRLPWRTHFYESVDAKRSTFSMDRRLKRLDWSQTEDPGSFVLHNLCPPAVQADYYPGQTYAEYLGSRGDLILCDYYVWITGVHSRADLTAWISFIRNYESASGLLDHRAVFVVEYDGPEYDASPISMVIFETKNYDCRVFCLQLASELDIADSFSYQAELALSICMNDPELAYFLLSMGNELLEKPYETTKRILSQSRNSDGMLFSMPADSVISNHIWKACLVLIYPIIEQYRVDFISRHGDELEQLLPISNSNGDVIQEISDLEIGPLHYIVSNKSRNLFSQEDADKIRLCRNVRNKLAHNQIPAFADISFILNLEMR